MSTGCIGIDGEPNNTLFGVAFAESFEVAFEMRRANKWTVWIEPFKHDGLAAVITQPDGFSIYAWQGKIRR